MAFGDNPGPPASHTQMRELTSLIESAGHSDFRDARGPLGLNQRQAGGKFTRDEADTFIAQLETELEGDDAPPPPPPPQRTDRASAAQRKSLAKIDSDILAAELQQRGWVVMEG
jgi:hypothetical protein